MTDSATRRTPLYDCHVKAGGKIVDFAGWEMPIQYQGIVAEHNAVRQHAGVFDVSHMGRVEVKGSGALAAVQWWVCNDVAALEDNQSLYSPICNEQGGVVDDCLVYRMGPEYFLIVVNASNRDKDHKWFVEHIPTEAEGNITITSPDEGDRWALLAVQGPKARGLLGRLGNTSFEDVAKNQLVKHELAGIPDCMLACTGYTGEDGFEVFVPSEHAADLWDALLEEGKDDGVVPCGLGARDTLRMEMKYPLYGNDIDDETSPIEAGLGWTVRLDSGPFVGYETVAAHKNGKPPRRLIGFKMKARGIPRHGYTLHDSEGNEIGVVTSGGFAPSLQEPIGIGYVPAKPHFAKPGSELQVSVRGKMIPVEVVKTPFHQS
ncbi:MAG: glycine cleavage system aminomethyltransferase GcvT [Deltaproteobacteria bacterium]|nr:MAG: glycine cleavage system aminomethyltransferase GcvT [Deltaproteobacteria bacterium]